MKIPNLSFLCIPSHVRPIQQCKPMECPTGPFFYLLYREGDPFWFLIPLLVISQLRLYRTPKVCKKNTIFAFGTDGTCGLSVLASPLGPMVPHHPVNELVCYTNSGICIDVQLVRTVLFDIFLLMFQNFVCPWFWILLTDLEHIFDIYYHKVQLGGLIF